MESKNREILEELKKVVWRGEENVRERAEAFAVIEKDPVLKTERPFDRTREQELEDCAAKLHRIALLSREVAPVKKVNNSKDNEENTKEGETYWGNRKLQNIVKGLGEYDRSFGMKNGTHILLFRSAIKMQGTEAQWKKYGEKIENYNILGCFAMTELGHSIALSRSETICEYVPETKELELFSPTLTSTKWWIGGAGHSATHAVVLAHLIVAGAARGLCWFVVQLRDMNTGLPCPNIVIGDVGPKTGRQGVDNGFIRFNRVRIPLDSMLMRWSQLDPDGTFHPPLHPALPYLTLIPERLVLASEAVNMVMHGLTIGLRYAFRRLQSSHAIPETPIIQYQTQYATYLPMCVQL